jgi:hypothetical protein
VLLVIVTPNPTPFQAASGAADTKPALAPPSTNGSMSSTSSRAAAAATSFTTTFATAFPASTQSASSSAKQASYVSRTQAVTSAAASTSYSQNSGGAIGSGGQSSGYSGAGRFGLKVDEDGFLVLKGLGTATTDNSSTDKKTTDRASRSQSVPPARNFGEAKNGRDSNGNDFDAGGRGSLSITFGNFNRGGDGGKREGVDSASSAPKSTFSRPPPSTPIARKVYLNFYLLHLYSNEQSPNVISSFLL